MKKITDEEKLKSGNNNFADPCGWLWHKYDNNRQKVVSRIKIGKLKYEVVKMIGQGKDGETYHCNHKDNPDVIIKVLTNYGRKYWHRYQTFKQRVTKTDLKNDIIVKQMLRWPIDGNKGLALRKGDTVFPPTTYWYKGEPYENFDPIENQSEWLGGIIDFTRLQEELLSERIAIWDLGFKSGLNYMKDETGKTVWVDFGGNAFAVPKEDSRNIFNRWVKYEPENDYQQKPQLGALTSNMLRWYFLLHLEFHHYSGWNIHDLNFISSIASALQTSSRFEDFLDPNYFTWRFDLIRNILHETDGMSWDKPKTWETVRAVIERYNVVRES